MRFELLPVVTYMWRRRGQPMRIPTPGSNRRVAVCGAMRWPNGPFRFGFGFRQVNTDVFLELLPQLAAHARRVRRRIVLVLDNGSYFTSRRSTAAITAASSWLTIFRLPPYSSEQLNEIEGLWRHLEEDYFSRMLVADPADFVSAAVQLLRRLQKPGVLRRVLKPRRPLT